MSGVFDGCHSCVSASMVALLLARILPRYSADFLPALLFCVFRALMRDVAALPCLCIDNTTAR